MATHLAVHINLLSDRLEVVNSGRQQGWVPSGRSKGESMSSPFLVLEATCISRLVGPSLQHLLWPSHLLFLQGLSLTCLPLTRTLVGALSQRDNPGQPLGLSILTLVLSAKPPLPYKVNLHRFLGLGCGRLWRNHLERRPTSL